MVPGRSRTKIIKRRPHAANPMDEALRRFCEAANRIEVFDGPSRAPLSESGPVLYAAMAGTGFAPSRGDFPAGDSSGCSGAIRGCDPIAGNDQGVQGREYAEHGVKKRKFEL